MWQGRNPHSSVPQLRSALLREPASSPRRTTQEQFPSTTEDQLQTVKRNSPATSIVSIFIPWCWWSPVSSSVLSPHTGENVRHAAYRYPPAVTGRRSNCQSVEICQSVRPTTLRRREMRCQAFGDAELSVLRGQINPEGLPTTNSGNDMALGLQRTGPTVTYRRHLRRAVFVAGPGLEPENTRIGINCAQANRDHQQSTTWLHLDPWLAAQGTSRRKSEAARSYRTKGESGRREAYHKLACVFREAAPTSHYLNTVLPFLPPKKRRHSG